MTNDDACNVTQRNSVRHCMHSIENDTKYYFLHSENTYKDNGQRHILTNISTEDDGTDGVSDQEERFDLTILQKIINNGNNRFHHILKSLGRVSIPTECTAPSKNCIDTTREMEKKPRMKSLSSVLIIIIWLEETETFINSKRQTKTN